MLTNSIENQLKIFALAYIKKRNYNIISEGENDDIWIVLSRCIREELDEIYIKKQESISKFIDFVKKNRNKSVIIFGAGNFGVSVLKYIKEINLDSKCIDVKAFLDNNPNLWGKKLHSINIIEPTFSGIKQVDKVIIASTWSDEIREQLLNMGVNEEKIISVV